MTDELKQRLIRLADRYEQVDFLTGDPSWFMHQVSGDSNREATAFVASALSYGSRKQFMQKIGLIMQWAEGDIDGWVRSGAFASHFDAADHHCFYRLYDNSLMCSFLTAYSELLANHGTLGSYVAAEATDGLSAVAAICDYFASKGIGQIVPKDTTSACKRVCMFLRWMVRSDSPVDLGLWSHIIDRRTLIIPLDTHVARQATNLGLITSKSSSMATARRLTARLAEVFPDDPLRGDFALFGYGVNESKQKA